VIEPDVKRAKQLDDGIDDTFVLGVREGVLLALANLPDSIDREELYA
jgi:hypothetical protein